MVGNGSFCYESVSHWGFIECATIFHLRSRVAKDLTWDAKIQDMLCLIRQYHVNMKWMHAIKYITMRVNHHKAKFSIKIRMAGRKFIGSVTKPSELLRYLLPTYTAAVYDRIQTEIDIHDWFRTLYIGSNSVRHTCRDLTHNWFQNGWWQNTQKCTLLPFKMGQ